MVRSTGKRLGGKTALLLCSLLVLLAGLLTACGETANSNNFDVPIITGLNEVPAVANDANFQKAILKQNEPNISGQTVRVFTTSRALTDVQKAYSDEMLKREWLNVTQNIIKNDELGSQGTVEAFEKTVNGDNNKKRVVGFIILTPDVDNSLINTYRTNGTIPNGQNVVLLIEGATGVPAATPTPTK